jgi:hypothetical protein
LKFAPAVERKSVTPTTSDLNKPADAQENATRLSTGTKQQVKEQSAKERAAVRGEIKSDNKLQQVK